jgi:hypothetical protein
MPMPGLVLKIPNMPEEAGFSATAAPKPKEAEAASAADFLEKLKALEKK